MTWARWIFVANVPKTGGSYLRKDANGQVVYSPSDLITYLASPFASWMDRKLLEEPGSITPDELGEEQRLIINTGIAHEQKVLEDFRHVARGLCEVATSHPEQARDTTLNAVRERIPVIYQAALQSERFAGFADFLILDQNSGYEVWDTKLARSTKPYYALQLCAYSEMFAAMTGEPLPKRIGVILGNQERVGFAVEDYVHYYRHIKSSFLRMQDDFKLDVADRPEPAPGADHGRWSSHAEAYFVERDHLVQVAGITTGQIKKLRAAGISTVADLSQASGRTVPRLPAETLQKLSHQADLQRRTIKARSVDPDSAPVFELISESGEQPVRGLRLLPPIDDSDVFFDIEGYPLVDGGLEYLFGASTRTRSEKKFEFHDWWARDRESERLAFEGFIDWVYGRWISNPGMHIYHYAQYEVSAVRRLSTRHDTRQDQVDQLLRNQVFVDLYQVVRQSFRVGEDSYSIKKIERLYRPKRSAGITSALDSVVQYANWIESGQSAGWQDSPILKEIRNYNVDDCESTAELLDWLYGQSRDNGIDTSTVASAIPETTTAPELSPEAVARQDAIIALRELKDPVSLTIADLVDFHRREEKPVWWRMFDRAEADSEELRDDQDCIASVVAVGQPYSVKQSLVQEYRFDPSQECRLTGSGTATMLFTHALEVGFILVSIDLAKGRLELKIGKKTLDSKLGGVFPVSGSLLPVEHVSAGPIQVALAEVAATSLSGELPGSTAGLLVRQAPVIPIRSEGETLPESAVRVTSAMSGGCFVIQGPPGTGKTYTASRAIAALMNAGKTVGVTSNSHKAVMNLMDACGKAAKEAGVTVSGIKVGGDSGDVILKSNPWITHVADSGSARSAFAGGVIGGTAWLFARPEWERGLDYLFIDEAGQVSLANALAISRCASNLVLLGDQMQLEQPIQGSHPGDAGLSVLQYALKDVENSRTDAPAFHPVVPSDYGLFLEESRRMHPAISSFISDSIYEGRLKSHPGCARQRIDLGSARNPWVDKETGIVFSGVEHDGNTQTSDEEVAQVVAIFNELVGRDFTSKDGMVRPLKLSDFLFVSPYNAQVRALQGALPEGALVGSVDRFQGQEAPVCILSLCSSAGEYGARGLQFILDQNRVNVAISRAQCLAVVVADPRIAETTPSSLKEMRLLNLFCKMVDQ